MARYTRREFIGDAVLAGGVMALDGLAEAQNSTVDIPKRPLGKTRLSTSILGAGGYYLGSAKDDATAKLIVDQALDAGINFFDNCWEYHDGVSEERLGAALKGKRDKVILMTKVCTYGRGKALAMEMLEASLRRLQTDHLDVWQIHEVIYDNDPDLIFAAGGAAEALMEAKRQGKVRFVGFTGHKDPAIHLKMLSHGFSFDTVQMPLNAFDASFRSFEQHVLPEANRLGIAPLGMKSLGGSGEMVRKGGVTPEEGLRYAMSLPVAVTISGMETPEVLQQNLAVARGFKPLSASQMQALRERSKHELFKTTKKYDGKEGRKVHEFPDTDELPA